MPEYIDKDKLLNAIECIDISNCTDVDDIFIEIERTIDEQPTADVVEIVRCKDCIFSRELDKYEKKLYLDNCVGCTKHSKSYHSLIMEDNDFCGYGERREVKNNA